MSAPELPAWLQVTAEGLLLDVHLQPRASSSSVRGEHGGRLKLALTAPPVDGKANAALLAFLAERLGLPKSALRLVSGQTSREKRVASVGATPAQVIAGLS